jgi:hypothetical protein
VLFCFEFLAEILLFGSNEVMYHKKGGYGGAGEK